MSGKVTLGLKYQCEGLEPVIGKGFGQSSLFLSCTQGTISKGPAIALRRQFKFHLFFGTV